MGTECVPGGAWQQRLPWCVPTFLLLPRGRGGMCWAHHGAMLHTTAHPPLQLALLSRRQGQHKSSSLPSSPHPYSKPQSPNATSAEPPQERGRWGEGQTAALCGPGAGQKREWLWESGDALGAPLSPPHLIKRKHFIGGAGPGPSGSSGPCGKPGCALTLRGAVPSSTAVCRPGSAPWPWPQRGGQAAAKAQFLSRALEAPQLECSIGVQQCPCPQPGPVTPWARGAARSRAEPRCPSGAEALTDFLPLALEQLLCCRAPLIPHSLARKASA